MSQSKLTQAQKDAVITIYKAKTKSITEMAKLLNVSTRTIGRVITEAGLALPVQRLQGEAAQVMRLLYQHKISLQQLEELIGARDCIKQVQAAIDNFNGMKVSATNTCHAVGQALEFQKKASRKSPSGHTGKQTMLPLPGLPMDHIPAGAA